MTCVFITFVGKIAFTIERLKRCNVSNFNVNLNNNSYKNVLLMMLKVCDAHEQLHFQLRTEGQYYQSLTN